MIEVEIKAYCDSHEEALKRIKEMGGTLREKRFEKDFYYNHPSRDFEKTDEALRIRTIDTKNILTYKGPKMGQKTKSRSEVEVGIDNFDAMVVILTELGFVKVGEVIKTRSIYYLEDIEICLDDVEGLGEFIELEKKKNEDIAKAEEKLFEMAAKLGLSKFERRSYLELTLNPKRRTHP